MVFLEPPPTLQTEVFLDRWQPYDTPALGFLFFWHSRHDQEKTAPGLVPCRLCRGRKAGDFSHDQPAEGEQPSSGSHCRLHSGRSAAQHGQSRCSGPCSLLSAGLRWDGCHDSRLGGGGHQCAFSRRALVGS